jgi:hypothetical protein
VKRTPSAWFHEFEKTGVLTGATKNDGEEHVAYCPSCEDPEESSTPSASFNFRKNKFFCQSCQKTFKFEELLMFAKDDARERAAKDKKDGGKKKKKSSDSDPLPTETQIELWARNFWKNEGAVKAFKSKRGLSDEVMSEYKIGYRADLKRFTLPIYDRSGQLVNVRYYSIRAKSTAKMINHTGHGDARLVGMDALNFDEILLCEGEMDFLMGRDKGFNSMTWTSGVASWQDKWNTLFEGKTVFICFDDDDAGRAGGRKVALKLTRAGAKCHIIQLSIENVKGGDLTDYFHSLGNTASDFRELMEESRYTVAGRVVLDTKRYEGEADEVSVESSLSASNFGKPLRVIGTVHGKAGSPYNIPRKVQFDCAMDWGDKCKKCSIQSHEGHRVAEFSARDDYILKIADANDERMDRTLLKIVGAPPTCPRVEIHKESIWTVEELMIMPSVEDRSEEVVNPTDRTVYNVSETPDLQINKTYALEGFSTGHPRDQKAVFQAWKCEPVQVDIERFEMTPDIYEQLKIFQPDDWQDQTPWEKLKDIAYDMSLNVTHIYGRPELHIGYDLVWHSVNSFYFGGQLQVRGWTECLVIGDTRTGKSEASHRLCDHYKSGVVKMADSPSLAGLVGGATQKGSSKQWGIQWGVIPLNDKRLVVLDEAGGIKQDILSAMSSVRSQGVAEIVKMGGQKTSARTRLVWIANPVTNRPISEMAEGAMDEIPHFIQTPEDIARFDFAMAAASSDVSTVQIDQERKSKTPHLHNTDDCKLLVTWVWSRKAEDIVWVDDTEEYIFRKTREFTHHYVEDLPLVQKQSFHLKLARLAAAVAARLFSTDETGEKVMVRPEHVDTALRFLDCIYGMESFGYKAYSQRVILDGLRAKRNKQRALDLIWGDDGIRNTLLRVMNHNKFKNRDFEERGGMPREMATMAVDQLIDLGMLKSMSRGDLKMSAELLKILKDVRREVDADLDREAEEEE